MTDFERELRRARARLLEGLEAGDEGPDLSVRVGFSYLVGVYLAVSAVRDARLLVEGPDCAHVKAQTVQGSHDLLAELTHVSGYHRVANTALHPVMMTASREDAVRDSLRALAAHPTTGAAFLTSMPMAFVTGADYERLCDETRQATGRDVVHVRGLSLQGDWLDGYAETLRALARQVTLPEVAPEPGKVAIVGYLHDRHELDHRANLAELRAMCGAVGLDVCSVWLGGGPYAELGRAAEAATILSLPYGRDAASLLARRTGARVVEMPLPLGLRACEAWMQILGEAFDAAEGAAAHVEACLADIVPRFEWVIPYVFQNATAAYIGDPHLLPGVLEVFGLLGMRPRFAVVTNMPRHATELDALPQPAPPIEVNPRLRAFARFVTGQLQEERLDLLVTNSAGLTILSPETAVVELGYPSLCTHVLHDKPYLGFGGFAAFATDLANALRAKEADNLRHAEARALVERYRSDTS